MKPSDPMLLVDSTLCCGMYSAGKVDISQHLAILGFSNPVWTLVLCVMKHSQPPDLKSSSNASLPFACITGPATDPSNDPGWNKTLRLNRDTLYIQQPASCLSYHVRGQPPLVLAWLKTPNKVFKMIGCYFLQGNMQKKHKHWQKNIWYC